MGSVDVCGRRFIASHFWQKKIRNSQQEKIPCALVDGDREAEGDFVSVRRHGGNSLRTMPVTVFHSRLAQEIGNGRDNSMV